MERFNRLKTAVFHNPAGAPRRRAGDYFAYRAYRAHLTEPIAVARGYAAAARMAEPEKHLYDDDLIAGSVRGLIRDDVPDAVMDSARRYADSFGRNPFRQNGVH